MTTPINSVSDELLPCPFCGSALEAHGTMFAHPRGSDCILVTTGVHASDEDRIAAWNRRAANTTADGVTIKPLEWTTPEQDWLKAVTPFGTFLICDQPMFGKAWRSFSPSGWATHSGDSADEVRQKTDAEYVKRIRSTLSALPAGEGEDVAHASIRADCDRCGETYTLARLHLNSRIILDHLAKHTPQDLTAALASRNAPSTGEME